MTLLRSISNSPNAEAFNFHLRMELALRRTIMGAMISVNLWSGRRRGVGHADREVAHDLDGFGEV